MAAVRTGITLNVGPIATIVSIESAIARPKAPQTVCLGQFTEHDPSPGRKPHICDICGPITDYTRTAKAMKVGDAYHLVPADELAELSAELSAPFRDPSFVPSPREQVEATTITGDKRYNLVPTAAHANYANLRSMLKANPDLCFSGLFTPRSSASLFTLEVSGDVLVMVERRLVSGLKALPTIDATPDKYEKLVIDAAATLVTDFDAEGYGDNYVKAVAERFAASTDVRQIAEQSKAATHAITEGDELGDALLDLIAAKKKRAAKKAPAKKTAARKPRPVKVA